MTAEHKLKMSKNRVGSGNPRARKVIHLASKKIYGCGKYAAIENRIPYGTLKNVLADPYNNYGFVWLSVYEEFFLDKKAV